MKNHRPTPSRSTLESAARRIGYQLTHACSRARLNAADRYERLTAWALRPLSSRSADGVIACESLADVADCLDEIEISQESGEW